MTADQRPLRQAARAVVLDPTDRIFLVQFHFADRAHAPTFWATPGGGIDPGESDEQALRRELREEVGDIAFDIGPHIWTSTRRFEMRSAPQYSGQTNRIHLVRAPTAELGTPLFSDEQLRAEGVIARRWWTVDELAASAEAFSPDRLPELVAELIATGPPDQPIDVVS